MDTLFLDSSIYLQLGILNEQLEWIDFREIKDRKGSSIFHRELYKLFEEKGFQIKNLKKIFLGNGPGSYTGVRLAEGMAQIFEWQNVDIYSFYCFEIPYFSGVEKGIWCTEAFKGEMFFYEWNREKSQNYFVKVDEFKNHIPKITPFYYAEGKNLSQCALNTNSLLKKCPQKIFSNILKRKKRFSPFYFRSLKKEFKVKSFE